MNEVVDLRFILYSLSGPKLGGNDCAATTTRLFCEFGEFARTAPCALVRGEFSSESAASESGES